jgi:hypothetical protein
MHTTRTIDYVVLLRGSVLLLLDESEEIPRPLDVVVQRGTNHYWLGQRARPADGRARRRGIVNVRFA